MIQDLKISYVCSGIKTTLQRYIKGINPIYNNSKLWYRKHTRQWVM